MARKGTTGHMYVLNWKGN